MRAAIRALLAASGNASGGGGLGGPYRYLRAEFQDSINSTFLGGELAYYESDDTRHPPAMLSSITPSPNVISQSSEFTSPHTAGYGYRGFDRSSSNDWLTTSGNDINSWLQVDLGSELFNPNGGRLEFKGKDFNRCPDSVRVVMSNTGNFSGEEVEIINITGLVSADWTNNVWKVFDF